MRKNFVKKIFERVLDIRKKTLHNTHPCRREAAVKWKKKIKNIFKRTWQDEFESYNSQTRQLERATNCSLKIDQRTDKREYPVDVKMTQEAFELVENFENWVLKFEVKTKTFSSLILNECDADENRQQRLNLRVWSWLRLNAGGMLYTCKSNGSMESLLSDGEWRTGE